MNILLSNDDGYRSKGLTALREGLTHYGKVITVAPHKDISASSSCLSVHSPVKVTKMSNLCYKVYGTPADCVNIGARGILKRYPDIVFSGINFGSNMGDDVLYSGTVGAAIEGRHAKFGSYAISIAEKIPKHFDDIDQKVNYILNYIFTKLKIHKTLFNINIPDTPFSKIKGIKVTSLGKRRVSKRAKKKNINGNTYFEIGEVGNNIINKGDDFFYIKNKYITVTPILLDMTNRSIYKKLK